jgi:TRAP-type C4-dicarboxylate transport system substrate-binding protein
MAGHRTILAAIAATAALGLGASAAGAQEITLKGASCFPIGSPVSVGFEQFVKKLNAEAKGLVQIKVVGGAPAIGSPFTMTRRMARGINDIIGCPDAYYGNILPEAPATRLSDFEPSENRKNGAWDYYGKLLEEKNVRFLSMAMDNGPFFLWLNKKISKPDLSGMHLRVAPVYTPFFKALGATVQRSNIAQVYTYMENGTVIGYGWPALAWPKAWTKVTKYWVDHGFYRAGIYMLMNLDKWKALTAKQRQVIMKVALDQEAVAVEEAKALPKQKAWLKKEGLQAITFQGADREKWLKTADDTAWAEVIERSPVHGPKLRKLFTRQ